MFRNSRDSWGWVSIIFHWVSALTTVSLFALGLWMVSLDYYSDWYQVAPHWHKSVGVLFIMLLFLRLLWRAVNPTPAAIDTHQNWEKVSAKCAHFALYFLLFSMLPTGYLIVTVSGQDLQVFNWFAVPSLFQSESNIEDLAGEIHEIVGFTIIGIATIHALGALKHHFFDKDRTLSRMLCAR